MDSDQPTPIAGAPLTLTTPTDVIAALPYLAGKPPDPGVVILAVRGTGVHSVFCRDLDRTDGGRSPRESAFPPVELAAAEGCTGLVVVAYGPPERVTPHVDAVIAAAGERAVSVIDALRVTGNRYWSYTCDGAGCCPAEGTPFDLDRSTVPASAVLHGIAPSSLEWSAPARSARVRAALAPVSGDMRAAMRAAVTAVEARARGPADAGDDALGARGVAAVRSAIRAERAGEGVADPEELAWLGVVLHDIRVRDQAWARITADDAHLHQRLWGRLTRHVPRRHRAAPASLLAVAAWQRHDDTLAKAALEVALVADPGYSMAVLMSRALDWGLPVERWREFAPRWLAQRAERTGE